MLNAQPPSEAISDGAFATVGALPRVLTAI